jgi:hypothetical protein
MSNYGAHLIAQTCSCLQKLVSFYFGGVLLKAEKAAAPLGIGFHSRW